jgi:anhydro-N-acetylmuramic acid kinase
LVALISGNKIGQSGRKTYNMLYRVIGVMSGSSLDGLDIAFVELQAKSGKWDFDIIKAETIPYPEEWSRKLGGAIHLNARDYLLLHADYGHFLGKQVKSFMEKHGLAFKVALVSSHGHTTFHLPPRMTAQLGDGSAIAAETGLPVITDLRAIDVALGGQGAPIVPMGEKLLWNDYQFFLNIGGIANISVNHPRQYIAYDICPANRVLNMITAKRGLAYDDGGMIAASGKINQDILNTLNQLEYYGKAYPKSLANDFGTDTVYPLLQQPSLPDEDALRTYTEHIAVQVSGEVEKHLRATGFSNARILVTGGGAFNHFLIDRLRFYLEPMWVEVEVPDQALVNFKEALVMALLGVLRWRDESTTISSVTGASRDGIGGAVWSGT